MLFSFTPLRNRIIKLIVNNPVPYRNTDIINPYLALGFTLFFSKYQSVILNELYYKGMIELHGDVDLFIKAKSIRDTKYISIAASLTQKGMAYYKLHLKEQAVTVQTAPVREFNLKPALCIVR